MGKNDVWYFLNFDLQLKRVSNVFFMIVPKKILHINSPGPGKKSSKFPGCDPPEEKKPGFFRIKKTASLWGKKRLKPFL